MLSKYSARMILEFLKVNTAALKNSTGTPLFLAGAVLALDQDHVLAAVDGLDDLHPPVVEGAPPCLHRLFRCRDAIRDLGIKHGEDEHHVRVVRGASLARSPRAHASSALQTTATFSSDIAYSDSPAASRASAGLE